MRWGKLLTLAVSFCALTARAETLESQILILTSYPDELLTRFEAAFERAYPDIHVQFLWKTGREAMPILRAADQGSVDVYWSPATRNFTALRDEGRLAPLTLDRAVLPGRIGNQRLSDSTGMYEAFEVAGYGIIANTRVLTEKGLTAPKQWADLADATFDGQVILPVPAQVGFAPALMEIMLQAEGWANGWTLLQRIAANAELATRGLGVSEAVAGGRRAAGPTIDFQALNAQASGKPVTIGYPDRTAWLPAHIAIPAQAPHPKAAAAFVSFALSVEGQKLLFHPDIRRHPVRPDAYASATVQGRNPFAGDDKFAYDSQIGAEREIAVAALFDALITRPHGTLRDLRKLTDDAAAAANRSGTPALIAQAEEARRLAFAVPLDEKSATGLNPGPDQQKEWDAAIAANRTKARELAGAVIAAASPAPISPGTSKGP